MQVEPLFSTEPRVDAPARADGGWAGFKALLDVINPLQHIPVVSTIYRAITGDAIAPPSKVMGGALFGGIGGFFSALVDALVQSETGRDIGGHIAAYAARPAAIGERIDISG